MVTVDGNLLMDIQRKAQETEQQFSAQTVLSIHNVKLN